jgi:archaellum component FlaC
MTCREKLKIEHPDCIANVYDAGCKGCPHDYGYLGRPEYCNHLFNEISNNICTACWDREIPGEVSDVDNLNQKIEFLETENKDLKSRIESKEKELKDTKDTFSEQYSTICIKVKELESDIEDKQNTIDMLLNDGEPKSISSIDEKIIDGRISNYQIMAFLTRKKFEALVNAGFTEDQAMSFLPMWLDEEV